MRIPVMGNETDQPLCPYCGHIEADAWEWESDDSQANCNACGKNYGYVRDVQVSYSTHKIPGQEEVSTK